VRSPRHLEYARTFQCLCSTNSHLLIDLHSNTTLLAFDSLVFQRRLTLLVEDTQPGQGREPSRASLPRTAAFRRSTTACRNILPSGKRACGPQLSTGPPNNSFESLGTLANWGFNARRFLVNEETVFSAS
jgi:hypothetical protein